MLSDEELGRICWEAIGGPTQKETWADVSESWQKVHVIMARAVAAAVRAECAEQHAAELARVRRDIEQQLRKDAARHEAAGFTDVARALLTQADDLQPETPGAECAEQHAQEVARVRNETLREVVERLRQRANDSNNFDVLNELSSAADELECYTS